MTKEEELKILEKNKEHTAREVLIETATRLFSIHGLEGTSTRDIAKDSGLNISLISYYFGGKEGLYKAVLSSYADRTSNKMNALFSQVSEADLNRDSFKAIMRAFVREVVISRFQEGDVNKILEREMMDGLPFAREIFENNFSQIVRGIVRLYELGQERKFIRADLNPYVLFFSLIHANDMFMNMSQCQTSLQVHMIKIPEQMDQYIEQMYFIFVEGVII